jgi:hypothetical protein
VVDEDVTPRGGREREGSALAGVGQGMPPLVPGRRARNDNVLASSGSRRKTPELGATTERERD